MTTNVLNIKISEVENKISNIGGLIKKSNYDAKIKDIEKICFATAHYNKFTSGSLLCKDKTKMISQQI